MGLRDKDRKNRIWFYAVLALYSIGLIYLYYNQLLYPVTGSFESDTAVHVKFAVEDGYYHSLAAFIYVALNLIPFSNVWIALILTVTTIGSVLVTVKLVEKVSEYSGFEVNDNVVYIISIFANFVMAFYIKGANRAHYIGYESANMWHNSTYTFMRFFAVLTMTFFLSIFESYKEKLSFKQWLTLSVLLAVTTGFKASFLTVFAPLLCIILVIDLCKGAKFKNVFCLGTTVLPSMLIMFVQSMVMSGEGGSNGYALKPFLALSLRGDHPKATLILSVLFPLIVFLFHIKSFYKDKLYFGTLIMWGIAFLEVFLLVETGERELDGNFMWGYSITLFFVFLVSMLKMYEDIKNMLVKKKILLYLCATVEAAILFWHVYTGINYFILLLTGVTYFA